MAGMRDTPPDIQDAMPYSSGDPSKTGEFDPALAKSIARECYQASTNWLNSGRRSRWSDSLRAFQGQHASGSKYLSDDYKYRSRLFRPKTRSMVRKGEAETAAAFFSNEDILSIEAQDENNPMQQASAEINKELIQYRLTKTIPWFLTVVGARQDCDVMGIAIGKAYWKYSERFTHTEQRLQRDHMGMPVMDPQTNMPVFDYFDMFEKADDHPWIDLIAPENFRFDPAADWRNVVATSPYLIELIPMYIADVRAKIEAGEWLPVSESALLAATDIDDDTTRRSREQGRVPGKDNDTWKPREFSLCWVRENIMRWGGKDWHYYTIGSTGELLSNPMPLKEAYLHGVRPYVVGFTLTEAHKTYPSSKTEIMRDLQTQTNDVANLRLDNVKLAVNPRQFVAEGKNIDLQSVRIFNPGKVVLVRNPREDVVWDRPPDVTASAYEEQDRINLDIDELTGGVSNSSIQSNRQVYEHVGNMEMMQGNSSQIGEYEQRVFAETFVEPLLRQLVLLEQCCETDPVILAIAGKKANLYQRFGVNQITDFLLQQELTTKVNVGIGSTNPQIKLTNFATAGKMLADMYGESLIGGTNFEEVSKEVFSLCGYKDGQRFFTPGFNPIEAMQQMNAQPDHKGDQLQIQHQQRMAEIDAQNQAQLQQTQAEAMGERQKANIQMAESQFKRQQQAQDFALEKQIAQEKLNNERVIALEALKLKERIAIVELVGKEAIEITKAQMLEHIHSDSKDGEIQQGSEDQEQSQKIEMKDVLENVAFAFTQVMERMSGALEKQNEISIAKRVPTYGANGRIESAQVDLGAQT